MGYKQTPPDIQFDDLVNERDGWQQLGPGVYAREARPAMNEQIEWTILRRSMWFYFAMAAMFTGVTGFIGAFLYNEVWLVVMLAPIFAALAGGLLMYQSTKDGPPAS